MTGMMFSIVTNHKQIKTFRHNDSVGSFIYEEAHKVLELDLIPWEIYIKNVNSTTMAKNHLFRQ